MKVLVATTTSQGERAGDFSWTLEGELVRLPLLECHDAERCGCGRGFAGVASHLSTTTARVADLPMEHHDYASAITADIASDVPMSPDDPHFRHAADLEVSYLVAMADAYPAGTILERDGDRVRPRQVRSER